MSGAPTEDRVLERFQAVRYRLLLIQRLEAAVGTGGFAYDGGGVSLHALRESLHGWVLW